MALKNIKYSSYRWVVHLLVWAVYFSVTFLPIFFKTPLNAKLYYLTHFFILVAAVYANIFLLMKLYFYNERYRKYIMSLIGLWLLGELAIYISVCVFMYPIEEGKVLQKKAAAMFVFTGEFFFLTLYKIAKELYFKSKRSKELEIEKMQAELVLLRSQLDAHFLFNTLNNLYLLVLNKSEKAPDAILMLSDLLSYNIYDSRQQQVDIAKECEFIENYINLQKLRLTSEQEVFFEVEGERKGYIEPLILFNFIENTFKHADGEVLLDGKKYFVYIKLTLSEHGLELRTINAYKELSKKSGVGIINAKKRLEIAYRNQHQLDIDTSVKGEYHVYLKIDKL